MELSSREHQCADIRLASARSLMLSKAMIFHTDAVRQQNDHDHGQHKQQQQQQHGMSSVMIRCRIRLCVVCLRLLQDDDEEVRLIAQSILSTDYRSSSSSSSIVPSYSRGLDGFIGRVVEEVLMDRLSALLTDLLVASYHSRCRFKSDSMMSIMLEFDVVWMHLSSIMDLSAHDALLDRPDTSSSSSSKIFEAEADNLYIEQTKSGKVLSQAIATAVHRILAVDEDDHDDDDHGEEEEVGGEQCKKHAVLHWLEATSSHVMSKVLRSLHLLVGRSAMERSTPSTVTIEDYSSSSSSSSVSSSSLSTAIISLDASLLSYQPDIFRHLYLSLHFLSLLRRNSIILASDLPSAAATIGISATTSTASDGGATIVDLHSSSGQQLDALMHSISLSELLLEEERSRVCIDQLHPWIRELIDQICS